MSFYQLLAWRLFILIQTTRHLVFKSAIGLSLLGSLAVLGYVSFTISHEVALAKNDLGSPVREDALTPDTQNISRLVDTTHVQARSHMARRPSGAYATQLNREKFVVQGQIVSLPMPILMYHKTPENFEGQLMHLKTHGYSSVSMRTASRMLRGLEPAPAKPVVITFDDGFSDQLTAIETLKLHHMSATFYVIIGGSLSNWCLGAERNRSDCGDDYMSWEQVKAVASNPLFEIGSHTFDHPDLTSLDPVEQEHQVVESKQVFENKLGVEITTLAYPYGHYNAQVAELAQRAGYTSAVSTRPGTTQAAHELFELHRIRDAFLLE